ncbi:hypothetical protein TNCV_3648921 [Trichonephila clavipes]|nr:hypothetical protein TNCV_3648921 [Trichonephila clavipes]
MLYHRKVLQPHTAYLIPAGTRYILLTVQKTVFGLDIIPETILPSSLRTDLTWGILEKVNGTIKIPTSYLLLPRLMHLQRQNRPLREQPGPSSMRFPKRSRVFITPIIRPSVAPVLIDRPSTTLASPQPVVIPELQPPVQIPSEQIPPVQIQATPELTTPQPPAQILLPDPPQPPLQILDPPVQIPVTPELTTPQPPMQIHLCR